jgi:arylsulfatase B
MLPDGTQGRWSSADGRVIWSTHMGNFEPDYDADNPVLRGSQPEAEPSNLTDAFTREAESVIARHRRQPFFLCLAYNAVHSPLQARDDYLKKFTHIGDIQRRIFCAMLAQLDDCVGRVLARLRTDGLEERTLFVFLSDNGGPTRELTSSNGPFRGEKGQLFEGGVRVPFLAQWKERLPAGHAEHRMVSALDIFPTLLVAAGAKLPSNLDGADLIPKLHASTAELRAQHYWRIGAQAALREGDWKIHRPRNEKGWRLHNLARDPGEDHDLAQSDPARVATLEAAWQKLDAEMVPPLWDGTVARAVTP